MYTRCGSHNVTVNVEEDTSWSKIVQMVVSKALRNSFHWTEAKPSYVMSISRSHKSKVATDQKVKIVVDWATDVRNTGMRGKRSAYEMELHVFVKSSLCLQAFVYLRLSLEYLFVCSGNSQWRFVKRPTKELHREARGELDLFYNHQP